MRLFFLSWESTKTKTSVVWSFWSVFGWLPGLCLCHHFPGLSTPRRYISNKWTWKSAPEKEKKLLEAIIVRVPLVKLEECYGVFGDCRLSSPHGGSTNPLMDWLIDWESPSWACDPKTAQSSWRIKSKTQNKKTQVEHVIHDQSTRII